VHIDQFEMVDPLVRVSRDMAVLTFQFVNRTGGGVQRWNTTEVYERRNGCWRIVHTHWSFTKPATAES
jgi:hypothetical protein